MKKPILQQADLPEQITETPLEPSPWLGKSLTSLTKDLTLEDPSAEFVAIGWPHFRRSPSGDVYIPTFSGLELEIVGFSEEHHCVMCKVLKVKSAGATAKT